MSTKTAESSGSTESGELAASAGAAEGAARVDPGARDLYRDPRYYDLSFGMRTLDLAFYGDAYVAAGGLALELGVGSGRIARPAIARGARVIGLDLSHAMLVGAETPGLMRIRGDIRALPFAGPFPVIGAPFNVLMHLYTDADLDACLGEVRRCLAPGGRFHFDVFLPDAAWFARDPTRWFESAPYRHPTWDAWYAYAERSAYDPATEVHTMWYRSVRQPGQTAGPARIEGRLTQRYRTREAFEAALNRAGLRLEAAYGDFAGGPLGETSESLVGVAALMGG